MNGDYRTTPDELSPWVMLAGCVALALALLGLYAFTGHIHIGSGSHITEIASGRWIGAGGAEKMCKKYIRAELKAPRSARFLKRSSPLFQEPVKSMNAWRWTTIVYAKNSFNATMPGAFACEVNGDSGMIYAHPVQ